jgi:hypothetical protein
MTWYDNPRIAAVFAEQGVTGSPLIKAGRDPKYDVIFDKRIEGGIQRWLSSKKAARQQARCPHSGWE